MLPFDPSGDYISIGFAPGVVGIVPVPPGLTPERVTKEIVPALEQFRDYVVIACRHPGKPCAQCRLEVINGAWAYMQKAAARLDGG